MTASAQNRLHVCDPGLRIRTILVPRRRWQFPAGDEPGAQVGGFHERPSRDVLGARGPTVDRCREVDHLDGSARVVQAEGFEERLHAALVRPPVLHRDQRGGHIAVMRFRLAEIGRAHV